MENPRSSIRKKILIWLMPLMLLLILCESVVLHHVAIDTLEKELDADLYETADDLSELIVITDKKTTNFNLFENAKRALLNDNVDKILYSVTNDQNILLSGDRNLAEITQQKAANLKPHFFFVTLNQIEFRVVKSVFNVSSPTGVQKLTIQIAATLNRRNVLANKLLIGILLPQLILVLLSFLIIWFAVKKGLAPLAILSHAVSVRSEHDLSPINLPDIPTEVSLVAGSVNQLMQRLNNLISAQNRFVADAAHQLRTPIAGAQAQLEVAELESDPAVIKSILPKAHKSLDRLLHTVNQLLILAQSQPEAAGITTMVPIDLNQLVKEIASDLAPEAIKKQIDLGFEASLIPAIIIGNVERLKDMLNNLLDNAIRYTQAGGIVNVALDVADLKIKLVVEDNGPGVSAAEKDKIFDRFHRVIGTGQEGSGLGLSIVKEICNLHGASISVSSGIENQGLKILINFNRFSENK